MTDDRTSLEPGSAGAMRDSERARQTAARSIPHQRVGHHDGVVAVVVSTDHPRDTVLAAGRIAAGRAQPLALVMFTDPAWSRCRSYAAMDNALAVARTAFPGLEVLVHLGLADEPGWTGALHDPVTQVVADASVVSRWADRKDRLPVLTVEEAG